MSRAEPTLDEAWRDVEAAAPAGSILRLTRNLAGYTASASPVGKGYPINSPERPTPVDALMTLAARLRERSR